VCTSEQEHTHASSNTCCSATNDPCVVLPGNSRNMSCSCWSVCRAVFEFSSISAVVPRTLFYFLTPKSIGPPNAAQTIVNCHGWNNTCVRNNAIEEISEQPRAVMPDGYHFRQSPDEHRHEARGPGSADVTSASSYPCSFVELSSTFFFLK